MNSYYNTLKILYYSYGVWTTNSDQNVKKKDRVQPVLFDRLQNPHVWHNLVEQ